MASEWPGRKDRPTTPTRSTRWMRTNRRTGRRARSRSSATTCDADRPNRLRRSTARPGRALRGATRRALAGLGAAALARLPAVRAALLPRLTRLVCAVAGGLLLCASFPSLNWWWAAVVAAALLAWVLTHPRDDAGGWSGLRVPVRAGVLSAAAALDQPAGRRRALDGAGDDVRAVSRACSACSPSWCGGCPGWPLWFALLWTAQEWLKSIFPFGGFPWGSVAFGQARRPVLAVGPARRAPRCSRWRSCWSGSA